MKSPETYEEWKKSPKGRLHLFLCACHDLRKIPKNFAEKLEVIVDLHILILTNKRFRNHVHSKIVGTLTTEELVKFQMWISWSMVLLGVILGFAGWRWING